MTAKMILTNGVIVTGDGVTVHDAGGLVIGEDGRILEVFQGSKPRVPGSSDRWVDLGGRVVVPGAVNAHAHALTVGPLLGMGGAPALSLKEALCQLDRHLLQGTTSILSLDGYALMPEVRAVSDHHPMHVSTALLNWPEAISATRLVDGSGLNATHTAASPATQIRQGAIAIGEVGGGNLLAGHGMNYRYLPNAFERECGVRPSPREMATLRDVVVDSKVRPLPHDSVAVNQVLDSSSLVGRISAQRAREVILEILLPPLESTLTLYPQAARLGLELGLPVLLHDSAPSEDAVIEAVATAPEVTIAGHLNHGTYSVDAALRHARHVRKLGGTIEVCTLDSFGARELEDGPNNIVALAQNGLIDYLATDYGGGAWDGIYVAVAHLVEARLITLAGAVRLATAAPAERYPGIAPDRGLLEAGRIADLVVMSRDSLAVVEQVYVGGALVVDSGSVQREGIRPHS